MQTNEEIEMQLWEYIDGSCPINDMQRISILIERNTLWKQKYDELSALHTSFSTNVELEQPSMRFTANVMDAVAATHVAPATKKYINKSIIRGIAAVFFVMLTAIFGYALFSVHPTTGTTSMLPKLDTSKFNLSHVINSETIMIIVAINIVIGLVFLDSILRRKKEQQAVKP